MVSAASRGGQGRRLPCAPIARVNSGHPQHPYRESAFRGGAMQGLMMDVPLLITDLIRFADRNHGDTEIVSKTV